ncbi:MAG: hypothetical protein AAF270_14530, partial [Pseudomonadota bacterium]
MSKILNFHAFMKSLPSITLGRQIQLAACVFVLLPAALAYGVASQWFERIDISLRTLSTPSPFVADIQLPAVIELDEAQWPPESEHYRALLELMDHAASVTIIDPVPQASDELVTAIRYNGSVYLTDALDRDGAASRDAARAAARGIAHSKLPETIREQHRGLQAWRLSGNRMRASAALMPLLPDAGWRERNGISYQTGGVHVLSMDVRGVPLKPASQLLEMPAEQAQQWLVNRHVFIGTRNMGIADAPSIRVNTQHMSRLQAYATFHAALASGNVLYKPNWGLTASWLLIAVGMFLLTSHMWRESRRVIASVAATLMIVLLCGQWLLAHNWQLQIDVARPLLALLCGFAVCFILTPDRQSNRRESFRSGLKYLRAGRLDAAFNVFRDCPPNASLMPTLYKLAIAFEKKGQPEQARSVFALMAGRDKRGPAARSPAASQSRAA